MSITTRPLTYRDLERFPDDGKRYEIIDGELHVSAAPLKEHQIVLAALYRLFYPAVETTGWGWVLFAPVDVRFADTSQVQPDLLVLRDDHFRDRYLVNTVHGAPDVVVEVLSPSNTRYDQVVKARAYAANGVPEHWLADPATRSLQVFALQDGAYVPVMPEDGRYRSTVVPGLTVDPTEVFAPLDRI